jgi:hypothetical protein
VKARGRAALVKTLYVGAGRDTIGAVPAGGAHPPLSPPLSYAKDGGLRQAPGHAAESSAMTKHAVVIVRRGPTGLLVAKWRAFAGGR